MIAKQISNTVLLVLVLLCSVACSDNEDVVAENSALKALLCTNKWYEFSESGYKIYTFDSQNQLTISYYDLKKNYMNETLTYSCSEKAITTKNQYGATTEYRLVETENHYIKLEKTSSTQILYRALTSQEIVSHLSGKWENNDVWYECYIFNTDNTYSFEQIIGNSVDEEESGPGVYSIYDDIWIEFSPNKNLPKYKHVIYFDEDWNLVFISPYSNTSSVYRKITSEDESSRPELTIDSPYYKEINGSKWILFDKMYEKSEKDKYMRGFELLEFTGNVCKRTSFFKDKDIYGGPYTSRFSIVGDTISFSYWTDLIIEKFNNNQFSLSNYQGTYTRFDNEFIQSFVGEWGAGELFLTLNSDGTYAMVVYEDDQNSIIEESFNGTYSIEPGFITMEPMPTGWGNPSGFFHYVTDFGNGKMSWYFPEKDGRVQWKKVKK